MSKRWVSIEPAKALVIPAEPACYVVYCDGKIGYIGQAANLRTRLYSYRIRYSYGSSTITPWGQFNEVIVKYRRSRHYGDWAMAELRLIRRLQPPFNCVGSIRKRRVA